MIYAVSDVHGCLFTLLNLLKKIDFKSTDQLYIVGDLIDRGNYSYELIEFVLSQENIYWLKGNHELMFSNAIPDNEDKFLLDMDKFDFYGTIQDIYSRTDFATLLSIRDIMRKLPYYKTIKTPTEKLLLVHGGVQNTQRTISFEEFKNCDEEDVLWSYFSHRNFRAIKDYWIVSGHLPTEMIFDENMTDIYIDKTQGWTDIDCGCVFDNHLACLNLTLKSQFYVETDKRDISPRRAPISVQSILAFTRDMNMNKTTSSKTSLDKASSM